MTLELFNPGRISDPTTYYNYRKGKYNPCFMEGSINVTVKTSCGILHAVPVLQLQED